MLVHCRESSIESGAFRESALDNLNEDDSRLHMLNTANQVGYANTQQKLNDSDIFRMLLHRVWQTAYNLICCVRNVIVHVYFHAYNRIRVGGEFAILRLLNLFPRIWPH
jgi:hypothetical protein